MCQRTTVSWCPPLCLCLSLLLARSLALALALSRSSALRSLPLARSPSHRLSPSVKAFHRHSTAGKIKNLNTGCKGAGRARMQRLYQGFIQALFRLFSGSPKALLRTSSTIPLLCLKGLILRQLLRARALLYEADAALNLKGRGAPLLLTMS